MWLRRSLITFCIWPSLLPAQQIAFPGAEGYGKYTSGGRGGDVILVTNLNADGPGSLQAAVKAKGPRTIVFRVSGTIEANLRIRNGDVTIAGHSAPGDGICIKGSLGISADNVIVRYLRVRPDPSVGEVDAIYGRDCKNIMLDHVSASWSSDEVLSLYRNENVTIQWCMMTEACAKILDGQNTGHRFGGIWGNHHGTYHHNLFAHNDSRNPRWSSGAGHNDYRNNVLYNWGYNSCYGGGGLDSGQPQLKRSTFNMVANYYKSGPATRKDVRRRIAAPGADTDGLPGRWFVSENVVEGYPDVTGDNWLGVDGKDFEKMSAPWSAMPINQESPREALEAVLDHVGCSFPKRDRLDARIVEEVRSGTASCGVNGIINSPADVGGWPELKNLPAPVDSDADGLPDTWERAHGLDPDNPLDSRDDHDKNGYTHLGKYLNQLVTSGHP